MSVCYLDASAMVKLIVREPESEALRDYLREVPGTGVTALCSSRLGYTEVIRALRRRAPELLVAGREFLRGVHWLGVTDSISERAAGLDPTKLRTLDSLHLATALVEASLLRHVVVYDTRLAEACRHAGLEVVAPGQ